MPAAARPSLIPFAEPLRCVHIKNYVTSHLSGVCKGSFFAVPISSQNGAPKVHTAIEGGLSRELGSLRTRVEGLGSCSGRSRRPPILKRFAPESAERIAGNEMALDVECVLDCGMNGQEPLC